MDSRNKVSAGFGGCLKSRHGIINATRCAEGFSPADEYRIVERFRNGPNARDRIAVPEHADFRILRTFGPYRVMKRNGDRGIASRDEFGPGAQP
jgi:hypothetical protein